MQATQLAVKFFVDGNSCPPSREFIPVFHRWIQRKALPGLLIDVVDYSHVHEGPGAVLIGHEAHYATDLEGGRTALLYIRKRDAEGTFAERTRDAFRSAVAACRLLELEESLSVRFRGDEIVFRIQDRLHAPNTQETLAAVQPVLREEISRLYDGADHAIEWLGAPRECFSVRITSKTNPSMETLESRVSSPARA